MFKKNNNIFIGAILMASMAACGGASEFTATPADLDPEATVVPYEGISGLAKATVLNEGVVISEGDLLDGFKTGAWMTYDNKGVVQQITNYYLGKKQGTSTTIGKLGYVEKIENYKADVLHGQFLLFERKRIAEERNYVNGELEGVVKKYYPTGKIMQEAPYEEGKMHGIAKWYDEEGNLSLAYKYDHGELVDKDAKQEVISSQE